MSNKYIYFCLLIFFSSLAFAKTREKTLLKPKQHQTIKKEYPQKKSNKSPSASFLLDKLDKLFRSKSSTATVEMKIETPYYSRTLKFEINTEGQDKTLIRIISPKKDKCISFLKKEDDMWNYFPKINKVMKIPPSMMMGSWMGSDFTNDDLVRENKLAKDFNYKTIKYSDKKNYWLELKPKVGTVTLWAKIEISINKKSLMPQKQIYYDEKNKRVRELIFSSEKKIGGRIFPTKMELSPLSKPNQKTSIEYLDASFDEKMSDNKFKLKKCR